MSNEQFKIEYEGKKVFVHKIGDSQPEQEQVYGKNFRPKYLSPSKNNDKRNTISMQSPGQQNLNGLVKIKAYDSLITDELPVLQCNLLPTQLDHVKLLLCEQEDKSYPKLTQDASIKLEIEKQN